MAKRVQLIQPETGLMKSGYYGFSWTFFVFRLVCSDFSWRVVYFTTSLRHHNSHIWFVASHHCIPLQQTVHDSYVGEGVCSQ